MYTMVLDGEPHWGPLERLADQFRARGLRLRTEDFLYVGREVGPGCPDIHLYRAVTTRRGLNLDDHGWAYWCVATPPDELDDRHPPVEYVPVPDLTMAIRWARS